ncbi:hypothetical protein [Aeromonas jandaei]|uniref:hypothetical protein n=1 Tax=Aeromonas jandaei TaxID=650 RepID=UPI001ADDE435|nr:hypothetical protein [Aeromonas jandaei]
MKKTTLSWAIIGAFGLAGCGGGGGDSGGGTTPPEPQPRALPVAGVYLPVLMDAQGQLINRTIDTNYRAAGFVYPTTEGRSWAFRMDEKNGSSINNALPSGSASLDKTVEVTLNGTVTRGKDVSFLNPLLIIDNEGLLTKSSFANQSLWVLDYRKSGALRGTPIFNNWGGQIALQPMVTTPIKPDSWYPLGESALFQDFKTERSNNGSGIKLTIQFIEGCSVSGETEANTQGLNKLMLTGWNNRSCSFNTLTGPADIKDGKVYEGIWETKMRDFADRNASVTAYLTMKPGSNGQKDTLVLGIPEITGITPFLLEAQPL